MPIRTVNYWTRAVNEGELEKLALFIRRRRNFPERVAVLSLQVSIIHSFIE